MKPPDTFLFEAVKPHQSQYKKRIKKITETIFQHTGNLNNTNITDKDDLIEKKIPHKDDIFSNDLSLIKNQSKSETKV